MPKNVKKETARQKQKRQFVSYFENKNEKCKL